MIQSALCECVLSRVFPGSSRLQVSAPLGIKAQPASLTPTPPISHPVQQNSTHALKDTLVAALATFDWSPGWMSSLLKKVHKNSLYKVKSTNYPEAPPAHLFQLNGRFYMHFCALRIIFIYLFSAVVFFCSFRFIVSL